jgi:hypothetical protein
MVPGAWRLVVAMKFRQKIIYSKSFFRLNYPFDYMTRHSKNDIVESTFLRRKINENSHNLSFYDSCS